MHAGKTAAGAIVVHHQVVRAQNALIAQHFAGDILRQLFAGRLAQKRVYRLFDEADAAVQNEQRHGKAHPAVQHQVGGLAQPQRRQHGRGADDIVSAVGSGGLQGGRTNAPANGPVEHRHPQLHANAARQHRHSKPAEGHGRRVQNFIQAGARQLEANDNDKH